jgi:CheY-like chemotaxis protein
MRPDKSSILIAEDNLNDVFLLKSAFKEAAPKMRVSVVGNGEELIDFLQTRRGGAETALPGLVLLDLKMPRVDGFEVLDGYAIIRTSIACWSCL